MRITNAVVMRRGWLALGAAVAALGLAGCPSVPQGPSARQAAAASTAWAERGGGVIEHVPSGMQFPAQVAAFKRNEPHSYDKDGLNVSAGYSGSEGVTITVYVFPIDSYGLVGLVNFTKQIPFNDARSQIAEARPGMKTISEHEVAPPRGAIGGPGLFGRYEFFAPYGGRSQQLESLLYVYAPVADRWIVKYRMTYPKESLEARLAVGQFVESFAWNLRGGQ